MGNAHSNMVPYQVFRCKEGDVIVAVGNDGQYRAFCKLIGRDDLAQDPRYATPGQRNRNREALLPEIAATMLTRSMSEWVEAMEAANVPCGPINNMQQVFSHPQTLARKMIETLDYESASSGKLKVIGV